MCPLEFRTRIDKSIPSVHEATESPPWLGPMELLTFSRHWIPPLRVGRVGRILRGVWVYCQRGKRYYEYYAKYFGPTIVSESSQPLQRSASLFFDSCYHG